MLAIQSPSGPVSNTAQLSRSFHELVDLAKSAGTTFSTISERFFALQKNCPHRFDYDYIIGEKGANFSKVVEIKGQQAHRFVKPIDLSSFKSPCKDGYTRTITINVPGQPQFEERLFLNKTAHGELQVIFVQTDAKDLFACINTVTQMGGEWHWSGSYLYGEDEESHTPEKMKEMFDSTYHNMLAFMDNQKEFDLVYKSLC